MKPLVFLLAMGGVLLARTAPGARERPQVVVYVDGRTYVNQLLMFQATSKVSELFGRMGVQVEWKAGRPHPEQRCRPMIALIMEGAAPDRIKPDVQASTELADGSVTVYYQRIHPMVGFQPTMAPTFLAYVMAHEIGHSLQGLNRHSETGIMKARWTPRDYNAMREGRMNFTALDEGLIREGVWRACPTAIH